MAKYEGHLVGSFDEILKAINDGILGGSFSASCEDGSDYESGGVRCAVRVYERYSIVGSNRVSLNVTLVGTDGDLFLSGIASGGSQAVLFKINTFGEHAFLDRLVEIAQRYERPQ